MIAAPLIPFIPFVHASLIPACHGVVRGGHLALQSDGVRALRRKFETVAEYRAAKAQAHGFHSWQAYEADLAIRKLYPGCS
jgi:hypothetical protein